MKFDITLPSVSEIIEADTEQEAIQQFWATYEENEESIQETLSVTKLHERKRGEADAPQI